MNAHNLARAGYARALPTTRSAKSIEYDVVARVTAALRASAVKKGAQFPQFAAALHDNRRLWTALAVDVAQPGNLLPEQVKAQILYLAEFTHQHTSQILTKGASVRPLLDINTAILRGLKSNGG